MIIDRRLGARGAVLAALVMATAVMGATLGGCGVEVREGVFACGSDAECPSGWDCRQPEGRCYRGPAQGGDGALADGGVDDGGLREDGGAPDGALGDGGRADGGPIDGGPPDGDHDGVPDELDCGPLDPTVGAAASRDCVLACGPGQETCTDGVWAACDAPTTCDCSEGATQTIPCGQCGMQAQQCTGNQWVDVGTCGGEGVCVPDAIEVDSQTCVGGCGTIGSQTRTRRCESTCTWGAWSAFGACQSCGAATEVDTQGCGACGETTRTRSCDTASCTWGAWSAFGSCTGEGVCFPGDSDLQTCGTTASCGGTRGVQERFCTDSCTWGSWGFCDCF